MLSCCSIVPGRNDRELGIGIVAFFRRATDRTGQYIGRRQTICPSPRRRTISYFYSLSR